MAAPAYASVLQRSLATARGRVFVGGACSRWQFDDRPHGSWRTLFAQ